MHYHLEITGSMESYPYDTVVVFCNVLPQPVQIDGDWHVALVAIISSTSRINITSILFFRKFWQSKSCGFQVSRESWEDNALSLYGFNKTENDVLKYCKREFVSSYVQARIFSWSKGKELRFSILFLESASRTAMISISCNWKFSPKCT